jgi:Ca-activated chloride channel family protein
MNTINKATISIQPKFNGAINNSTSEVDFLVTICAPEKLESPKKRPALNISLVIDTSPSMSGQSGPSIPVEIPGKWVQRAIIDVATPWTVNNGVNYFLTRQMFNPSTENPSLKNCAIDHPMIESRELNRPSAVPGYEWIWTPPHKFYKQGQTKMERVIAASISALDALTERDRVSIIEFSGLAKVRFESSFVTPENKIKCKKIIQSLTPDGNGTALHAGWKAGATAVLENLSKNMVNRVLLLTDGDANVGIKDPATLTKNTRELVDFGVTTSTFGVGVDFSEDLLQKMAEAGDGRYYYLEESTMSAQFQDEFSSMSQLYGREVRLFVESDNFMKIDTCLNNFQKNNDSYILPSIVRGNDQSIIVRTTVSGPAKAGWAIKATLNWKTLDGQMETIEVNFVLPSVTQKAFSKLIENPIVGERLEELLIAKIKRDAMVALDTGDIVGSQTMLRGAMMHATSSVYASVQHESHRLTSLSVMSETGDVKGLRKSALFDSYQATNSRKINRF